MWFGLCHNASILFIISLHLPTGMLNSSVFVSTQGLDRYTLSSDYDKNEPPDSKTQVNVSLFIHRVSAVDESKEEISLEVFLQVYWVDHRVNIVSMEGSHIELNWEKDQKIWVPDLYIRQLRDMKVLALFQEMTFVRLYQNKTLRVSMGATIQIKCDMDFDLYPLDVQKCFVDFSSYKYTAEAMEFHWAYGKSSLSFPSDFGKDGYRLPKYVVTFEAQNGTHCVFYGEGNHSTARMLITMSREIRSHLLESYLPSTLFVIMSWGSFVVMPEVVPGRMVLLVTTLLSLVTMFDTIRNNSPSALELKCIEVWLISCTLFVFFALLEYFIVLFGIRYDKHWRHKKNDVDIRGKAVLGEPSRGTDLGKDRLRSLFSVNQRVIPQSPLAPKAEPESMIIENHCTVSKEATPTIDNRRPCSLQIQPQPISPSPTENHLNQVNHLHSLTSTGPARDQPTPSTLADEGGTSPRPQTQMTTLASAASRHATLKIEVDGVPQLTRSAPGPGGHRTDPGNGGATALTGKQKFRLLTQHVILYAGSQRGTIDQVSLALFPFCFTLFALIYWISYLTESRRRANE